MSHLFLTLLGVGGFIVAFLGLGYAVVAGADPEGRGGSDALLGLLVALLGTTTFFTSIGLSIWQYFH